MQSKGDCAGMARKRPALVGKPTRRAHCFFRREVLGFVNRPSESSVSKSRLGHLTNSVQEADPLCPHKPNSRGASLAPYSASLGATACGDRTLHLRRLLQLPTR